MMSESAHTGTAAHGLFQSIRGRPMPALTAGLWILGACATTDTVVDTTPTHERYDYDLLFNVQAADNCKAAFHKDGLLYLVTRGRSSTVLMHVTVYDPQRGVFFSHPISQLGKPRPPCVSADFHTLNWSADWLTYRNLHYVLSPELRNIFDRYKSDPYALRNAIDRGAPHFRSSRAWGGESSTVQLPHRFSAVTFEDAVTHLRELDAARVDNWISNEEARLHERQQRKAQEQQERQSGLRSWENRHTATLQVGDPVCTYDSNLFGNVEVVQDQRVKMYVIGQAQASAGFFYAGRQRKFNYEKIEGVRWIDLPDLAHCNFAP